MPSLTHYQQKYGKREGRKRLNAYQRAYRKKHKVRLNEAQRGRYKAMKTALLGVK